MPDEFLFKSNLNKTLAKRLLELKERPGISADICQPEMAAHTLERISTKRTAV